MNNLHEYIGLIVAIIVVLIVIAAQIYSFLKTKKKISGYMTKMCLKSL